MKSFFSWDRAFIYIYITIFLVLLMITVAYGKQTRPDKKRIEEIRASLISHGYPAESSWPGIQDTLRKIAQDHGWQTCHAPDARVLILLGQGSGHADPDVLEWPISKIEKGYIEEICQKKK